MIDERLTPGQKRRKRSTTPMTDGENSDAMTKNYSNEALAENQPLVTDLLPKRAWWVSLLLLLAIGTIAGLQYLYQHLDVWGKTIGREKLAALDVTQSGSIAAWYGSLLLLMAAVGSLLIYSLRRYKIDDYRGRYRIWLWATASLLIACLAVATPLHQLVSGLFTHLTGTILFGNAAFWWISAYAIVFGTLLLRMLIEVRHSRVAFASLSLAAAGYVVAVGVELKLIVPEGGIQTTTVQSTATLLAHLGVSFAVGIYARYVFLDSQGLLPVRVKKIKEEALEEDEEQEEIATSTTSPYKRQLRVDTSHTPSTSTSSSTTRRSNLATSSPSKPLVSRSVVPASTPADEPSEETPRRLTKAQRKRLRKLKRQQAMRNNS